MPTPESLPLTARPPGRAVLPGDAEWDAARTPWNLAIDQRPGAVGRPGSPEDVIALVRFARERGLRVAVQATGHGAGRLAPLDGALLIRTSGMHGVSVDAAARRARVEAGAAWGEVALAAAEHGLAGLAGSSPTVGVVGYTLGGGAGWLARRYGFACSSLLAAELVMADGRLARVDADHDPDLFWALRGGGGGLGVVTALEFALYPVAEIEAGALLWPMERAAEILGAWREWSAPAPDEVTSVGRLVRIPPLPDVPPPLRGRDFVMVEVYDLGGPADAEARLRPLRALGPELDTVATIPAPALGAVHMDPRDPTPALGDGLLLDELPAAALDALVRAAGPDAGPGSALVSVEVRRLGGALARPAAGGGALDSVDAEAAVFGVGVAAGPPGTAERVEAGLRDLRAALRPWTAARNLMTLAERPDAPGRLFTPQAGDRLRSIKARHDPDGLFRADDLMRAGG